MARTATIQRVNRYELHGVLYYQMILSYDDAPDRLSEVRLPHDNVYPSPSDGDLVNVDSILTMVTGISKREA